ncbi:hypothetical protein [Cellulomonas sp.]|uniref:hypothetical protein n=1 Tax=Cellulomonas sp. TaxID=40001 RepID=UPI001B149C8F|nr:hypothetical protein [Cellulomonas sp.]MBO9555619.1 hypothetical protein [Cellulomonas sp.]
MPDRRRVERTPDTVSLLAATAGAGVVVLVTGTHPPSIVESTGYASAVWWACVFTAGAVLSLAGVLWRAPLGWVIELTGRMPLAAAAAGYVIALGTFARSGVGAAVAIACVAAIAVGSTWRACQLAVRIVRYRDALHDLGGRR